MWYTIGRILKLKEKEDGRLLVWSTVACGSSPYCQIKRKGYNSILFFYEIALDWRDNHQSSICLRLLWNCRSPKNNNCLWLAPIVIHWQKQIRKLKMWQPSCKIAGHALIFRLNYFKSPLFYRVIFSWLQVIIELCFGKQRVPVKVKRVFKLIARHPFQISLLTQSKRMTTNYYKCFEMKGHVILEIVNEPWKFLY